MYETFYGFREKPFSLLPDPEFLYPSEQHRMAMALLEYTLTSQSSFSVVTGGIGTGKTTLIRHLLSILPSDISVGLISNTHRSFGELLQWILLAYNIPSPAQDSVQMFQAFADYLIDQYAQNRRTLLVIDEAQNMSVDALEELRMLSNINSEKDQLLQILLVGQAELRDTLRRQELEQFAQRISVDYHLDSLNCEDTRHYIHHRLVTAGGDPKLFEDEACEAVFRYSGGIPRLINLLCDTTLVYGYAEQAARIHAALVDDVAHEKQRGGIFPIGGRRPKQDSAREPMPTDAGAAASADAGTARHPVRVAIMADDQQQREHLRAVLEKCGMEVVSLLAFDGSIPSLTDLRGADIVMVSLDENVERELGQLQRLLDDCPVPVLFNDSSDTSAGLADSATHYRKRLTLKLSSIIGS